jgi:pyroglutamyl-peptidase
MTSVLVTAFGPYDRWTSNSSWRALVELTRELPAEPRIVTRLYPVDFEQVRSKLESDLAGDYDYAIHLGQAPGIGRIHLEAVGINIGGHSSLLPDQFQPLVEEGPVGFRSTLPLSDWAGKLREAGIPAQVSYHAGTYLCNAVLYLSHYFIAQRGLRTKAAFIHLPLCPEQVLEDRHDSATLPTATVAAGLRLILEQLQPLTI